MSRIVSYAGSRASAKDAGPIRVRGRLGGLRFTATVVRYGGAWRLYLNTAMRADAAVEVGDEVDLELEYDPAPRTVPIPPRFAAALANDPRARAALEALTSSHRKDILNYLNWLKTDESLERNIQKAIAESLAGRDARRARTRKRSATHVLTCTRTGSRTDPRAAYAVGQWAFS